MKICSIFLSVLSVAVLFAVNVGAAAEPTLDILAAYIEGTEEKLDLASMTAVGAVIVNRCNTDGFPDSVTSNGAALGILPSPTPSEMARYAAILAASGFDPTNGALYIIRRGELALNGNRYRHVTYAVGDLCFAR